MKVTAQIYGQFLLSSQVNYTGTYLAEHLAGLTHDKVQYFLKTRRFTPRQLWQQVQGEFVASERGYVLFDDTVLNKSHSHKIELVRRQYSGNAHGLIKGIGLVNCVYVNPDTDQFWLLDYRLFAPQVDGKDKGCNSKLFGGCSLQLFRLFFKHIRNKFFFATPISNA